MESDSGTKCYAVVVAAGLGSRLRSETKNHPKVYYKLLTANGEVSLLALAVRQLATSKLFQGIVIVCDLAYQQTAEEELKQVLDISPSIEFISGGATRQESVFNGLKHLEGREIKFVAIHDAARPFVSIEALHQVVHAARETGAAILVEPLTSTLKKVGNDGRITETHPRTEFVLAQTPQVFTYELILRAHIEAAKNGYAVTDDSDLVERLGVRPTAVFNESPNPKVTEPKDLDLARSLALKQ